MQYATRVGSDQDLTARARIRDAAIGLFAEALGKAPGNDGYRRHLMLALEMKSNQSASINQLKALLSGDLSPASMEKVQELLQSVRSSIR